MKMNNFVIEMIGPDGVYNARIDAGNGALSQQGQLKKVLDDLYEEWCNNNISPSDRSLFKILEKHGD